MHVLHTGNSTTGSDPDVDVTEVLTAGAVITRVEVGAAHAGTYPSLSAVHDGTKSPSWDTAQGLDSALGGQDVHPLESVGAEIMPMESADGTSMILGETSDASRGGSSDETNWVSHPSAIGYRRAGGYSASCGSHVTISEVMPEFDSGMNEGSTGEEMERITDFYTGAEENPTVAQSAPTPRNEQQASGMGPGGSPSGLGSGGSPSGGPSMDGIVGPSNGNEPTWRAGANPFSGHGFYSPFGDWMWPSFWPFGGGGIPDATGSGGLADAMATGNDRMYADVGLPGTIYTSQSIYSSGTASLHGTAPSNAPTPQNQPLPDEDYSKEDCPAGSILPFETNPPTWKTDEHGDLIPPGTTDGSQISDDSKEDCPAGMPSSPASDAGGGSWDEPDGNAIVGAYDGGDNSWGDDNGAGSYSLANDILTRASGGLQAAGGFGAAMIGGALIVAPEPTMLTKVGGGALAAVGIDNYLAGMNTLLYGKPQQTVTSAAVEGLALEAGADALTATTWAKGRIML